MVHVYVHTYSNTYSSTYSEYHGTQYIHYILLEYVLEYGMHVCMYVKQAKQKPRICPLRLPPRDTCTGKVRVRRDSDGNETGAMTPIIEVERLAEGASAKPKTYRSLLQGVIQ